MTPEAGLHGQDAPLGPEPVPGRPLSWSRGHQGWAQASEDKHPEPERGHACAQRHLPPDQNPTGGRGLGAPLAQAAAPSTPHSPRGLPCLLAPAP